jgi:hypothetical protein
MSHQLPTSPYLSFLISPMTIQVLQSPEGVQVVVVKDGQIEAFRGSEVLTAMSGQSMVGTGPEPEEVVIPRSL